MTSTWRTPPTYSTRGLTVLRPLKSCTVASMPPTMRCSGREPFHIFIRATLTASHTSWGAIPDRLTDPLQVRDEACLRQLRRMMRRLAIALPCDAIRQVQTIDSSSTGASPGRFCISVALRGIEP